MYSYRTLYGTDGHNVMVDSAGNEVMYGRGGNDFLVGDAGDDMLDGGPGRDILFGGSGADIFRIADQGTDQDIILDFNPQDGDRIDLTGFYECRAVDISRHLTGPHAVSYEEGAGVDDAYSIQTWVTLHVDTDGDISNGPEVTTAVGGVRSIASSDLIFPNIGPGDLMYLL